MTMSQLVPGATEAPVHPALSGAFESLSRSEVPWALLRGADDLTRPAGDVDLLVGRSAIPRAHRALTAAGFRRLGSRGHGSHRFYFSYVASDDLWITLDVVTEIEFGPFQEMHSPLAGPVLDRRSRHGTLYRPAPPDEAWLLLLHLLLDKGRIPPVRRAQAREAAGAAGDSPVAAFLDRRIGTGTAARVPATVLSEDPDEADDLAGALARAWMRRRRPAVWGRRARNRILRRLEAPVRWPARGPAVALVGPDGAGKTTLAEALRAHYPLPSRAVHMGIWRAGRWNRPLARIPAGSVLQRTSRIVRGSLAVRYHRARGRLVVLDRFTQEVLLPGAVDTSRGGRLNRMLSLRLAPEPDLVLLLDAPGELMFARKGEHTAEVLERRRQDYLAMVTALPHGAVLDATRPVEEVRRAASAAVWQAVRACAGDRHATPYDHLLRERR